MIGKLRGKVDAIGESFLIVDVNGVGYEVGYERIGPSERFTGRDVLLVPDDPEEGKGYVLLSLRVRKASGEKLTPRERNLAYLARKAYRSFRFGTERG